MAHMGTLQINAYWHAHKGKCHKLDFNVICHQAVPPLVHQNLVKDWALQLEGNIIVAKVYNNIHLKKEPVADQYGKVLNYSALCLEHLTGCHTKRKLSRQPTFKAVLFKKKEGKNGLTIILR